MITCDLKIPGTFDALEIDGKFAVRDMYGEVVAVRETWEAAKRIADAANKSIRDYNNGDRISHGGDI